jgi:hypothetical protein
LSLEQKGCAVDIHPDDAETTQLRTEIRSGWRRPGAGL